MTDIRGYHRARGEGKALWFLDTLMTVKADGDDTRDAFTLIEFEAPTAFGPPMHIHHREDEGFYVLEGQVLFGHRDLAAIHVRALPGHGRLPPGRGQESADPPRRRARAPRQALGSLAPGSDFDSGAGRS